MTEPDLRHISLIGPEERAARGIPIKQRSRKPKIEDCRRWRGLPTPTRPEPATCENCGRPPGLRCKHLNLDHDHKTGAFRGWLCRPCNQALGMLGDTLEALERVVAYLRRGVQ